MTKEWKDNEWSALWDDYQADIPEQTRSIAQRGDLRTDRRTLYKGLVKAESSALTQMRIEKIGLAYFLHMCRVLDFYSEKYICGWRKQDVKYILLFCPELANRRQILIDNAGTQDI